MTEAKHTPGPWTVEDPMDFELTIVEANKPTHEWKFIASCSLPDENDHDFTGKEVWANARLIAAAPELLEALKELRAAASDMPSMDASAFQWDRYWKADASALAAIAKAEGTTS